MRIPRLAAAISVLLLTVCNSARAQYAPDYSIPYPQPITNADTLSILIVGDVMMHSRQLGYDCHGFFAKVEDAISSADFAVGNMEFPLGGEPYKGYPVFSTPDYYADYLKEAGFDVFLMANNHILDMGSRGMERTLSKYRELGILYTGGSSDEDEKERTYPLVIRAKGISVALVNFTYGTNSGVSDSWPAVSRMGKSSVHEAINRAKDRKTDFIVALPHWGNEYELKHSERQEDWARWLVSEGVSAVVGAHPHVVQDSTHISGVPVIYSMGNAVSNMSAINTRLELCVTLRFTIDRMGDMGMFEPELRWMWCTLPGTLTDGYATIFVDEWIGRRDEWKQASDYDNMIETLARVRKATGIE